MARDQRVLLVDDDEQLRILLQRSLQDRSVICDVSAVASDALRRLSHRRYALMLLHLEMPDAPLVLDCIHSMRSRHRPIVLLTAGIRAPKDDIDTELVQIIIRRPLRVAEVAGMIRACLEFIPPLEDEG